MALLLTAIGIALVVAAAVVGGTSAQAFIQAVLLQVGTVLLLLAGVELVARRLYVERSVERLADRVLGAMRTSLLRWEFKDATRQAWDNEALVAWSLADIERRRRRAKFAHDDEVAEVLARYAAMVTEELGSDDHNPVLAELRRYAIGAASESDDADRFLAEAGAPLGAHVTVDFDRRVVRAEVPPTR